MAVAEFPNRSVYKIADKKGVKITRSAKNFIEIIDRRIKSFL